MERCKPIMKWAGGKSQLLKELLPRIPDYSGKYIEPFFGGGALYLAYQFFMEYGFKNYYGDQTVDSKSARSAILISESGLGINLVRHIKK